MAELAPKRIHGILKPVIELLAGIPSVVYGFFGLVVLVPLIQKSMNLPVGETAFAGAVVLAIMALPTIVTVAADALRTVPKAAREASLALGASQMQTIFRVTIPYCASGIMAAVVLGLGGPSEKLRPYLWLRGMLPLFLTVFLNLSGLSLLLLRRSWARLLRRGPLPGIVSCWVSSFSLLLCL